MFLKAKTRQLTNNKRLITPVSYQQAKTIGIIINTSEEFGLKSISTYIKLLEEEGKKLQILCFINNNEIPNFPFHFNIFSKKDFNWKGMVVEPGLAKFINNEFDYLFSLDFSQAPEIEYVLAASKAKFRAGAFDINKKDLYELMVQPTNKSIDSLFSHLYYYSKKIS